MKAKKSFRLLATRNFPDNTHLSFCFETEVERDISSPDELRDLADLVYRSTLADLKERVERNAGVRVVWQNVQRQLTLQKKREGSDG